MDYRFARAFLATAESRSFSKAAKDLKIAQSAVSRQIKLLEESLEFQLFFRSNKNVNLTERGQQLYQRLNNFDKWVANEYHAEPTEIRINALDGLLNSYIIPKISQLKISQQQNIRLMTLNHQEIEASINRGETDIALTYLPIKVNGYACRKLFEQSMFLISSKPINDLEISKERWIHMGRAEFLNKLTRRRSGAEIIVNSLTTMVSLVRSGFGVAVVPEYCIHNVQGLQKKKVGESSKIYLIARDFSIEPQGFKSIISAIQTRTPMVQPITP
jgi:DNA-binding transcriptional LysR family regulator